ncbi:hypothetical protein ABPG75_003247 [Micractinium tetrahymenae]
MASIIKLVFQPVIAGLQQVAALFVPPAAGADPEPPLRDAMSIVATANGVSGADRHQRVALHLRQAAGAEPTAIGVSSMAQLIVRQLPLLETDSEGSTVVLYSVLGGAEPVQATPVSTCPTTTSTKQRRSDGSVLETPAMPDVVNKQMMHYASLLCSQTPEGFFTQAVVFKPPKFTDDEGQETTVELTKAHWDAGIDVCYSHPAT